MSQDLLAFIMWGTIAVLLVVVYEFELRRRAGEYDNDDSNPAS